MTEPKYTLNVRSDKPIYTPKSHSVKKDVYTYERIYSADSLEELTKKLNKTCDICDINEIMLKWLKVGEFMTERRGKRCYLITRIRPKLVKK
jgi:hypothetical protein